MKNILIELSEKAILLGDVEFSESQQQQKWLGKSSATIDEITSTENRLGIQLPDDYKKFLSISNGFSTLTFVEPTLLPIDKIDYLKNIDDELIKIWAEQEVLQDVTQQLSRSILIGGINEEQYFLLIPPTSKVDKWKYWKFASWIPGEEEFNNLEHYFKTIIEFFEEELNE